MKRIVLFLATNIAVMVILSIAVWVLGAVFGVNAFDHTTGGQLNYGALLIFSAVFGFGGAFISLAMSKWMAKRSMGAQVIERPSNSQEAWLMQTVQRLARQAGIGMPEVAIFQSPSPNAFATGASKNNALVAVSTGLLQNMSADEVEAVLGHEIGHVANGDMVTLTLIQGVVNTFVIFLARVAAFFVDRLIFRTQEGRVPGYFISWIVFEILFGVLASVVVCWFSRQREFRADAAGAHLAGRRKMIAALRRLQGGQPDPLPDQFSAFGIAGHVGQGLRRLFMTHPPLGERIRALESSQP